MCRMFAKRDQKSLYFGLTIVPNDNFSNLPAQYSCQQDTHGTLVSEHRKELRMDELRVVRREDQTLIVANESGEEFRLVLESSALAEIRSIARQLSGAAKVSPRKIQALVRAGKTRQQIVDMTGADEIDIERYEEPVLAERRFILANAQDIAVRTSPAESGTQKFGSVIAERLIGLAATTIEWSAWKDEDTGWLIGLTFESHGVAHRAVWSFDHRKGLLSPLTPDAVNLSKQGELGDRLIPKLRAVDDAPTVERFDSGAFDHEKLEALPEDEHVDDALSDDFEPDFHNSAEISDLPHIGSHSPMSAGTEAALRAGHPSTGSIPIVSPEDEYARRREIDERAIKTSEEEAPNLGQTADLLDALRRRRDEREEFEATEEQVETHSNPVVSLHDVLRDEMDDDFSPVTASEPQTLPPQLEPTPPLTPVGDDTQSQEPKRSGKGRPSIPSWDDILFGTRSEEDPSD